MTKRKFHNTRSTKTKKNSKRNFKYETSRIDEELNDNDYEVIAEGTSTASNPEGNNHNPDIDKR